MTSSRWQDILTSDCLLASLIPLVLFVLSLQILGSPKDLLDIIFGTRALRPVVGHFSVQRAAASYRQYVKLSRAEAATMLASYGCMRWSHRRIGYELGYPAKLTRLEDAIAANGVVADAIAGLAAEQFPDVQDPGVLGSAVAGDLGRVRESLKHFVRDWSEEGRVEREKIFRPVLDVLRGVPASARQGMRVLVPGAGLGRLAWDISELGECILVWFIALYAHNIPPRTGFLPSHCGWNLHCFSMGSYILFYEPKSHGICVDVYSSTSSRIGRCS